MRAVIISQTHICGFHGNMHVAWSLSFSYMAIIILPVMTLKCMCVSTTEIIESIVRILCLNLVQRNYKD